MENALKTARNEFKLSDAQIKNTGTALEQMRNKSQALSSQLQQQTALTAKYREALEQANAAKEKARERLDAANAAYKEGSKQLEKNSEELKKLKEEVTKAEKGFASVEKAMNDYTNKLYNSQTAEEKLKAGIKSTNEEIRNQEKYITQVNSKYRELSAQTESVQKGLTKAGRVLTASVTAPLVTAGIAAGKAAVDFEDAFAGIEKTVEATPEQFAEIRQGVRDMAKEIPLSAAEIAKLGEMAGQLGIHTDSVLSFSRVIADLSVSTNLAGEEGASMLAKFANITQMPQENFERLGSVIVDLGNHLATTEADIARMGQRLAGAGTQIGLSEAQILSLAGGLSSVGIEAEAGGSAFSKVMVNMQLAVLSGGKELKKFAQVAGMGAAQFKKAFQTDAAGALLAFIEGLGKAKEQGSSAIEILEDMGISEVRMRDALLRASSAGDLFRESLELGERAWKENTALANEASKRYETTASQLQIMKNNIYDAGITLGETFLPYLRAGSEKLKEFAQYLSGLDEKQKERILKIGMALAALGPTLSVLSKGITVINGARAAISALGTVTGGLGGVMALLTGPVGIAITALGAAGAGAYAVVKANEAAQDAFYHLGDAIEAAGEKYDEAAEASGKAKEVISNLQELNEEIESGTLPNEQLAAAEQKRKDLEEWLIDNYGDYITAEEEKNGIRQETLDKVEEINEKLTEQRRLELESQVFEERKNVAFLKDQVETLKEQNEALEKQGAEASGVRAMLELLKAEWENFSKSGADETQKAEKLKEIAAKVEELTGKSINSGAQLDAVLLEYADTVNETSRKMAENNEKIQAGEKSISQYTDACRRLIELELGNTYDSFSASMDTPEGGAG